MANYVEDKYTYDWREEIYDKEVNFRNDQQDYIEDLLSYEEANYDPYYDSDQYGDF